MALELFTAEKIAELAFGAVIGTGAGKLTEGAIAKGKQLWQKIRNRLKGEPTAEAALVEVEQNHSKEHLAQVVPFLQVEMLKDPQFAQEIQTLAQEITNVGSQDNIETKDFEAHDNAAVAGKVEKGINKVDARDNSIVAGNVEGGIHIEKK